MPEIRLVAETGRTRGTGSSRRLRHAGKIPAIVYGHGIEPVSVAVDARALRAALSTEAGHNAVIELDVAGAQHLAMAKDIQRHPVRGTVAHIDFLVVSRNERVTVDVPVNLIGEAGQVQSAGGLVAHELFALTVHTTPGRIPTALEVDISGLGVGGTIRVGDMKLPDGVTTDVDADTVVAVGHGPAGPSPEEVAAEEAAAVEVAAAEGVEGAEAAAAAAAEAGPGGSGPAGGSAPTEG